MKISQKIALGAVALALMGCGSDSPSQTPDAGLDAAPPDAAPVDAATDAAPGNDASTIAPVDRIATREVGGDWEFYHLGTDEQFVARGNNYVRLDNNQHATFSLGLYSPGGVEIALQMMNSSGYNVVRVFLYKNALGEGMTAPGVNQSYMDNVIDFLQRVRDNGVRVMLTFSHLPANYFQLISEPHPANVDGINLNFLSQSYIDARKQMMQDIIQSIIDADPGLLDAIFSYDIINEAVFYADNEPFSLSTGTVSPAAGGTYDLSDLASRMELADNSAIYWVDQLRAAIRELDPLALVGCSVFPPTAVDRPGYSGVTPIPANPFTVREPFRVKALADSTLDYVDVHIYPSPYYTLDSEMTVIEHALWAGSKPLMMGELGAFKTRRGDDYFLTVLEGAVALETHQIESCTYNFDGWLTWTWDTFESSDRIWHALEEGGAINAALAPTLRPDPCAAAPAAP